MDDDLELNFAAPSSGSHAALVKRQAVQKGGRWTDRYVLVYLFILHLSSIDDHFNPLISTSTDHVNKKDKI